MSNSLMIIFPYQYEDNWVFDDEAVGLKNEPFVCGVPGMIDILVKDIPDAKKKFKLIFSKNPFPKYQVKLIWIREEYGGNWYYWEEKDMNGWLCPALFRYFDAVPLEIYCKAEGLNKISNVEPI
ncbi:DUF6717 family protein [Nostoc sp. 'Peltigera membranacea cyanobiont' N6]|uniref:DUF6717 family protein n=1 Tax=Nostoc sp. 'Peltigera membranacea cyanobiont' N6 TaxID=1261031 RepID=UPI000CF33EDA|nr:DUF6717 family protein [Nostoc sp. 'Peltigera membranacea cyanobiont' N6]AVH68160.1 hypothetical protein NPM_10075 [Nostoc sp. 'Peltigera membranacea cyanobiont' N6]